MANFIALFIGAANEEEKSNLSQEESDKFMREWGSWAQANQASIIDHGVPLGSTMCVSASGHESAQNSIVAYSIIQAVDHKAAASIFFDHPHVRLKSSNSIQVIEGLDVPQ